MILTLGEFHPSDIFFHPDSYEDNDIVIIKGNKYYE